MTERVLTYKLDVEVIKHYFREDKEPRTHTFTHPESLENNRGLLASIMPTLERWASAASQSTIGRGSRPPTPAQTPLPQHRDRTLDEATTEAQQEHAASRHRGEGDVELHRPGTGSAVPVPIPDIRFDPPDDESPAQVVSKPSLRARLFGRKVGNTEGEISRRNSRDSTTGSSSIPMQDRSSLGRPHITTALSSSSANSSASSRYHNAAQSNTLSPIAGSPVSPLDLTRSMSNSVSRTIRFAPDSLPSSDTVPGPAGAPNTGTGAAGDEEGKPNYGNNMSGFKRTPGLGLFRTSSIKEDEQ